MDLDQPTAASTVSGRSYTRTRPRGFAEWKPRRETAVLIAQVQAILEEYRDHLPMTGRQIFYRSVAAYGYPKTEAAYERLLEHLVRARRARMIPMGAIRDDSGADYYAGGYQGPAEFWRTMRSRGEWYQHDPTAGQPQVLELWVEAAGMVPMIGQVAVDYGVSTFSGGGFSSVTGKYDAAARISQRRRPTTVLVIGDYDPSGLSIMDAAAEDVTEFTIDLGGRRPRYVHLAVTPDQIARYQLPTAPQKARDRRGEVMAETVQAESLSPTQLVSILRQGLEDHLDLDALAAARHRTEVERAEILEELDRLGLE
ncbi:MULTISPECIES: hypothetical protein [Kitasatospora]|uniref:hypothetical protein n=1 Tax=Kitasatospora TaxID=2063 RepID=UPI000C280C99|nr:hypothetical protein [Kitasatospora sp. CB02891]PJN21123.1 hypothetical protein CG736_34840 [Kitasatospora sp. CB02891]